MDKLKYYDVVGHLVPGLVFLAALGFVFVEVGTELPTMPGGEGVQALLTTALAYYIGRLLAIAGAYMEPLLFFVWGGKPSRQILTVDTKYLHPDVRERVRRQLAKDIGLAEEMPKDERKRGEYLDSLFGHAQSISNRDDLGRVAVFNATYCLHRSLCAASILAGVICLVWTSEEFVANCAGTWACWLILAYFGGGLISLFAAKVHGYYFAREVIRMYLVDDVPATGPRVKK